MKRTVLIASIFGLTLSCTDSNNMPNFIGDAETRGFCGQSGQPYENPITNDIDTRYFEEVTEVEEGEYQATRLSVYYRESEQDLESPQVLATHTEIFLSDEFMPRSFFKNCARGFKFESEGQYEAVLPLKMTMNRDQTWTTQMAAKYSFEYKNDILGGLKLTSELYQDANPSSDNQDFVQSVLIRPIAQKQNLAEPQSYDEFKDALLKGYFLDQFGLGDDLDVEKQYKKYLTTFNAKNQSTQVLNPNLLLQIEVSSNPKVYARIQLRKIEKVETAE